MARDNFGNYFPNRRDIFVEKTFFLLERRAMLKLACGLPQLITVSHTESNYFSVFVFIK